MKTQVKKIGQQGSLINQIMGNNSTEPVVGEWATICHYTDRSVCKVVEVSEDGMSCKVEHYDATADKSVVAEGKELPIGHQSWKFHSLGYTSTIVWRQGAWRIKTRSVEFTKEYKEKFPEVFSISKTLSKEMVEEIYQGRPWPQKVVEGITKEKFEYPKISILFGKCDYYYDWSF